MRRAYSDRSRCYDRATSGSRQECRKSTAACLEGRAPNPLHRPDAQGCPLALLQRPRRARDVARRLQLVQQPRRLRLWNTKQIGDHLCIGLHVLVDPVHAREDGDRLNCTCGLNDRRAHTSNVRRTIDPGYGPSLLVLLRLRAPRSRPGKQRPRATSARTRPRRAAPTRTMTLDEIIDALWRARSGDAHALEEGARSRKASHRATRQRYCRSDKLVEWISGGLPRHLVLSRF